ncbi:MAG: phosphoribosylformylglycinamidine synthase subunit PurQ [Sandaracinaceae bacterium]|nr:phosphoribosylformylglycinamidine synthase subunit PurQ [Sandaracinaceae bacterium]
MKVAVVVFPGSNADWDALHTVRDVLGVEARYVFHKEHELGAVDAVVIPGGFSYGDYLRAGAIARFSPIASAIASFADGGGPVLGICNGFQVLTELGLLPGALTRNAHLRFECRDVWLRVEGGGPFTHQLSQGSVLRLPIAHAEGRFVCDPDTLARIEAKEQVAFRYCSPDGSVLADPNVNPNGSLANIAGVYNEARNVLGLMPHPERAAEAVLGNEDGLALFECLRAHVEEAA